MAGISINFKGFEEYANKLKQLPPRLQSTVNAEMKDGAMGMRNDMIANAPSDEGFLRNEIQVVKIPFGYSIESNAFYSAYVEFGTGSKVSIPAGFADYAAQFQGKAGRGGIDDFFLAIFEWVKRKGLAGTYSVKTHKRTGKKANFDEQDYDVAFAIMLSILKRGINPHPFFIPAFVRWEQLIKNKLEKIVNDNLKA